MHGLLGVFRHFGAIPATFPRRVGGKKHFGYNLEHDKIDRNKKLNIPIQVLWGKKGVIGKQFNSIKIWQRYSNKKVYGVGINSGHFIPEQNPKQVIFQLKKFFLKHL